MNQLIPVPVFTLPLNSATRKELKALAHHLSPVVMIGDAGLTPAVLKEISGALKSHALIKIKVAGDDRQARIGMLTEINAACSSDTVQTIGKLLVVYKPKPEAKPKEYLPKRFAAEGLTKKPKKRVVRKQVIEPEKPKRYANGFVVGGFEEPTRPGKAPRLGGRGEQLARRPAGNRTPTGSGRR